MNVRLVFWLLHSGCIRTYIHFSWCTARSIQFPKSVEAGFTKFFDLDKTTLLFEIQLKTAHFLTIDTPQYIIENSVFKATIKALRRLIGTLCYIGVSNKSIRAYVCIWWIQIICMDNLTVQWVLFLINNFQPKSLCVNFLLWKLRPNLLWFGLSKRIYEETEVCTHTTSINK